MYEIRVNNTPNPYFDATEIVGTIAELSLSAVRDFLAERQEKGPRYRNAQVLDFELDQEHPGHADCAVSVGGHFECFDIGPVIDGAQKKTADKSAVLADAPGSDRGKGPKASTIAAGRLPADSIISQGLSL